MKQLFTALPLALATAITLTAAPAMANHHEEGEQDVTVTSTLELPADATWQHSFDSAKGEKGALNAGIGRALAFYRMMEEEGVAADRVKVAVVIHGSATFDVANDARYAAKYGTGDDGQPARNPNYNNVAELIAKGGEIWVCGVAAKYHKVGDDDVLAGVQFAPSAMVAHAELQRRGFSLNPY